MKIANIERQLHNLNARDLRIDISKTQWGWFVRMSAKLNRGYYDVEVTNQISDESHELSERQVIACFRAAETDTICAKPYHDESDPYTDYCAWNFYGRIRDLIFLNERVLV